MTDDPQSRPQATSPSIGRGSGERFCYVVRNHGDGTGTVALNRYEMSDGRDYMGSELIVRADLETAREVVRRLNENLKNRVHAPAEEDWSGVSDDTR